MFLLFFFFEARAGQLAFYFEILSTQASVNVCGFLSNKSDFKRKEFIDFLFIKTQFFKLLLRARSKI